jgi:ankyrin repeat protein
MLHSKNQIFLGGFMKTILKISLFVLFTVVVVSGVADISAAANPVMQAVATGDLTKVTEALFNNPNVNKDERDSSGGTALHGAMFVKNDPIVLLLITHGYDVNAVGTRNGYTPLHDAVWANYPQGAQILITFGDTDVTIKNKDGLTALDLARKDGKKELIVILEKASKPEEIAKRKQAWEQAKKIAQEHQKKQLKS